MIAHPEFIRGRPLKYHRCTSTWSHLWIPTQLRTFCRSNARQSLTGREQGSFRRTPMAEENVSFGVSEFQKLLATPNELGAK